MPPSIQDVSTTAVCDPTGLSHCAVIIPTCNVAAHWDNLHNALRSQNVAPHQVLIVDSTSDDDTRELVESAGYRLVVIPRASFRHGATRSLAASLVPEAEFLIYLTQDAIPYGESFSRLIECFRDPLVGAAYGRQLPRPGADAIERHARLFNYSEASAVRDFSSRATLGFRAAYFSNSFAAYRRSAFEQVGGFPNHVIVSEEVSVVARMLISGWKVAYKADACVYHSHKLTLSAEFCRYFDIAVHHSQERWIIERFGSVRGEGVSFLRSELKYLWKHAPHLVPLAFLRNFGKWVAYQGGLRQGKMPVWLKRAISAHPLHWEDCHERRNPAGAPAGTLASAARKKIDHATSDSDLDGKPLVS